MITITSPKTWASVLISELSIFCWVLEPGSVSLALILVPDSTHSHNSLLYLSKYNQPAVVVSENWPSSNHDKKKSDSTENLDSFSTKTTCNLVLYSIFIYFPLNWLFLSFSYLTYHSSGSRLYVSYLVKLLCNTSFSSTLIFNLSLSLLHTHTQIRLFYYIVSQYPLLFLYSMNQDVIK